MTFEKNCYISMGRCYGYSSCFFVPHQVLGKGGWLVVCSLMLVAVTAMPGRIQAFKSQVVEIPIGQLHAHEG